MDILYIVIPAYNEAENLKRVLDDWYPVVEKHAGGGKSRIVIINDGSTDDTPSILKQYSSEHTLLIPLTQSNSGHGAAILHGYEFALNAGADYIFQTDSDGQTLPEEFEEFWNLRNNCDMAIGWRKKRQDGISRIFVTRVLRLAILFIFHTGVRDANTPYRLMKAETLKRYIGLIPNDFHLTNILISVIFSKKHCRVTSLPITFRPRQGGKNSINFRKITGIGVKAVREFFLLNKKINKA